MRNRQIRRFCLAIASTAALTLPPNPADAYQVDCAILLCLSGGWPASAPCAHARAVFIRRITPWPIEPPLQIWRCPMGIAANDTLAPSQHLFDLAFSDAPPPLQSYPEDDYAFDTFPTGASGKTVVVDAQNSVEPEPAPSAYSPLSAAISDGKFDPADILQLVATQGADIDISDPAFDFVRSIKVWDVRHFSHRARGREGDCTIEQNINLGTYGPQGAFSWRRASYIEAPSWVLPVTSCSSSSSRRGVGVEWKDYEQREGTEWVSY